MNKELQLICSLIEEELKSITILLPRIETAWKKAARNSDDLYLDSVALNLHGFYAGIERIFELIAKRIDDSLPSGENWHRELLKQMTIDINKVRPAVISKSTYEYLNNYRGFRHIVRNVYTFNLSVPKLQVLIEQLQATYSSFKNDIEAFCHFISE